MTLNIGRVHISLQLFHLISINYKNGNMVSDSKSSGNSSNLFDNKFSLQGIEKMRILPFS